MSERRSVRLDWFSVRIALVAATIASLSFAQNTVINYSARTDVIYGRKVGLALTLDVFTPAKANGLGVMWVGSSSGNSSRAQIDHASFTQRLEPFIASGYTVFAVMHGSAPVFQVVDFIQDIRRSVRYVRYNAKTFGVDPDRLGIVGSSSGGLIA